MRRTPEYNPARTFLEQAIRGGLGGHTTVIHGGFVVVERNRSIRDFVRADRTSLVEEKSIKTAETQPTGLGRLLHNFVKLALKS